MPDSLFNVPIKEDINKLSVGKLRKGFLADISGTVGNKTASISADVGVNANLYSLFNRDPDLSLLLNHDVRARLNLDFGDALKIMIQHNLNKRTTELSLSGRFDGF